MDLFPPNEEVDEELGELLPDLLRFVELNEIRCFTALVVQLGNQGLTRWVKVVQRNAEFWGYYFDKWTRDCPQCEVTTGEWLDGLDIDWGIGC